MTRAETEAEQLVSDFGLCLPIKPEEVCEQISTEEMVVEFSEKQFESVDICGLSIGHGNGISVVVNSGIDNLGRKRFTGAHEIGHVILHVQQGIASEFKCTNSDISGTNNANRLYEKEANEFASSLLMPKSLIGKDIISNDLTWNLINTLASECETSLEATARRVVNISDERCAMVIHKNGEMLIPIRSVSFNAYIDKAPFPRHLESYTDGINSDYPDFLYECDSMDWFSNTKNIPAMIQYMSIYNAEYDRRMTLIVLPEEDDETNDEWEDPVFR